MYIARLICTDPACAETLTVEAASLRELETMACECGCGLEILGWPDHVDERPLATVLEFRPRRSRPRHGPLPDAA